MIILRAAFPFLLAAAALPGMPALAGDCNENGVDDALDLLPSRPAAIGSIDFDSSTYDALAADLDGDGLPDLAFSFEGRVESLLNDGWMGFPSRTSADPVGGGRGLAAADLDGDGDVDLAVAAYSSNATDILRNDGTGGLEMESVPMDGGPWNLAAGDLDGDGTPDLAATYLAEPRTSVLFNRGDGTFRRWDRKGASADSVAIADLDLDDDLDLVFQTREALEVLPNAGGGTFEAVEEYRPSRMPYLIEAADLDGDLAPELVTFDFLGGAVGVLRNAGDGSFLDAEVHAVLPNHSVPALSAYDDDGDGAVDVVVGMNILPGMMGRVVVLRNSGAGWLEPAETRLAFDGPLYLALPADLDGDGRREHVIRTAEYRVDIYPADGTAVPFSLDANSNGIPDECEGGEVPLFHRGDAGGDGRIDLADPLRILERLFLGAPEPGCLEAADVDDGGAVDMTDAIALLEYLFLAGAAPADPGPPPLPCGADPGPRDSAWDLGCLSYPPCE